MTQKYPLLMRFFHWAMASLIIVTLFIGLTMEDYPKDIIGQAYMLHKSLGVTIIILYIARVITRLYSIIPKISMDMNNVELLISKIVHFALYIFMLTVPLSGYLMSVTYGKTVSWFGIDLPNIIAKNENLSEIFSEMHEISANILIALIVLHIVGFLKHLIIDKNNLLKRML